jgi:hypothetical protein
VGYALAASQSKGVFLAQGNYLLSDTLQLSDGISIYGGFSGLPDWRRGHTAGEHTSHIISASHAAIVASNLLSTTTLEYLSIISADNGNLGGSTYGVKAINSHKLVVRKCKIVSGTAAAGRDGDSGGSARAANGGDGHLGGGGCEGSWGFCGSCAVPAPGNGGLSECGQNGGKVRICVRKFILFYFSSSQC